MKTSLSLLMICLTVALAEPPRKPLMFTKWPPVGSGAPQRALMIQIRSNGDGRPIIIKRPVVLPPNRFARPIKAEASKQYSYVTRPVTYKKPYKVASNYQYTHTSSPQRPSTEYAFERPFTKKPQLEFSYTMEKPIQFAGNAITNYKSPIHTVPAPNLSEESSNQFIGQLRSPSNNKDPLYPPLDNNKIHQYQVTEDSVSDQSISSGFVGKQNYYNAIGQNPKPTTYSKSNTNSVTVLNEFNQPNGLSSNGISYGYQLGSPNNPGSAHAYQFVSSVPQLQLPDNYALPLNNQPQLQQHFLQQLNNMPTAYNPTYLIEQSNNLFNQHQKQLFKPEPTYANSPVPINYNTDGQVQSFRYQGAQYPSVASAGQMYVAAQDQANQLNELQYNLNADQTQVSPQYSALSLTATVTPSYNDVIGSTKQPALSQEDLSNLLNYGTLNVGTDQAQQGFVASNYYSVGDDNQANAGQNAIKYTSTQEQNNDVLRQAQYEMQSAASAYEQHQKLLEEQFNGNSLKIVLPDEPQQNISNLKKRHNSDEITVGSDLTVEEKENDSIESIEKDD